MSTHHVATRIPFLPVPPFTQRTYALVDAYVAERGLPTIEHGFVDDAGVIVFANDVLLERGTLSWDACDASVVREMCDRGFAFRAASMTRAVLDFRRWLLGHGHASDAGIDSLERLALEAEDDANPPVIDLRKHAEAPPNRSERRWQAREARRMRRH